MRHQVPTAFTGHPPLTGGYLDRDAATRMSEERLDAAWGEPTTRLLRLRNGTVAVREVRANSAILDLVNATGVRGSADLYLGRIDGRAVFAVDCDAPQTSDTGPEPAAGWLAPLEFGDRLSPAESEMLAVALALSAWHASAPFSARDGSPTSPALGGWARLDKEGREHFPRTDPVVIVLVEDEDRLLLGSNVLWERGRFSLLAGFVESGESAEQAVRREVLEESGLRVDDVRYVTSQPWPFPRSFMLGFRARPEADADPSAVVPDPTELSELRWFTRDELRDPPQGIRLPGKMSIARWLLDQWIAEGDSSRGEGVRWR